MAINTYFKIIIMPALLAIILALEADATALESGSSQSLRAEAHGSVTLMAKMAAQIEKLEKTNKKLEKTNKQLQSQVMQQATTDTGRSEVRNQAMELTCKTRSGESCTCRESGEGEQNADGRVKEEQTGSSRSPGGRARAKQEEQQEEQRLECKEQCNRNRHMMTPDFRHDCIRECDEGQ